MKNVLVLQSGGPTAAVNATLAGVVERGIISSQVDKIYGSRYGIMGVLEDNIVEIGEILDSPRKMKRLMNSPGAALGSCRKRLGNSGDEPEEYEKIFATFEKYNIGYVVCIGGNDSMDTVVKLTAYVKENDISDIYIMGAPKTIDNDLHGMDHSPGFPSAARYVATTFVELWADCNIYDIPTVTIVEVMGRHVGWLAASSAVAKKYSGAPSLIYLPERVFSKEQFLFDVKNQLSLNKTVVIAISEGIKYEDGSLVSEDSTDCAVDDFGHKIISGAGNILKQWVCDEMGIKVRAIELSLMQRSAGHITSGIDIYEARMLGSAAMNHALKKESGKVSVLNRISSSPYRVKYSVIQASEVANLEKAIPDSWINKEGNYVTEDMIDYLEPLINQSGDTQYINGMPNHLTFL